MNPQTVAADLQVYLADRVDACLASIVDNPRWNDITEARAQAAEMELERVATPFLLCLLITTIQKRGR